MTASTLRIPVGDLTFDAVADGPEDGVPVLLLHGFPESSWAWRNVQPGLATAGFRTVAPDQRGYSPDARPTDAAAYAIEEVMADALGMADDLGWDSFHVVGHDWGGVVAWHLAGRHAARVRSLAAVSTPHPQAFLDAKSAGPQADGEDQAAKSSYMDFFREEGSEEVVVADGSAVFRAALAGTGLDDESVDHYIAQHDTAEKARGLLNWYRGATPDDGTRVGDVTVPTLYVWSDADAVFGRYAAEATAGHVTGPYRFETLAGVSHWIPEEAASQLTALLRDHLSIA
ncbi:MAG: alpha/beta hydrolase [Acidimicrobiales bacterium]|nr:alpha/beta hydrolase [Acidimicrobiales bacterium]